MLRQAWNTIIPAAEQEAMEYKVERLRELIRQDTLDKIDAAVDEALDEQMGLQDKKGFL